MSTDNDYSRTYLLEELSLILGSIAMGLPFLPKQRRQNAPKKPLFIVYPRKGEPVFNESQALLNDVMGEYIQYDIKHLAIKLRNCQVTINGNQQEVCQASFEEEAVARELLSSEEKNILFLISIGNDYHEGIQLQATIDLFLRILRCGQAISADAASDGALVNVVSGPWNIFVLAADTLQAYNHAQTLEELELQKKRFAAIGERWLEFAKPMFNRLNVFAKVQIKLWTWEETLAVAKSDYEYERLNEYLTSLYARQRQAHSAHLQLHAHEIQEQVSLSSPPSTVADLKKTLLDFLGAQYKRCQSTDSISLFYHLECMAIKFVVRYHEEKTPSPVMVANLPRMPICHALSLSGYSDESYESDDIHFKKQCLTTKHYALGYKTSLSDNIISLLMHNSSDALIYNAPPFASALHIARPNLENELYQHFIENHTQQTSSKWLMYWGEGGVGKSHLISRFSDKTRGFYYAACWLDCSSENMLNKSCWELAMGLGLLDLTNNVSSSTSANEIKQMLCQHLSDHNHKPTLIILENISDLKLISSLSNLNNCHVVVLARTHLRVNILPSINFQFVREVKGVSPEQAIDLLALKLGEDYVHEHLVDLKNLAEHVGYLPLALDKVAQYLDLNKHVEINTLFHTSTTVVAELALFAKNAKRVIYALFDSRRQKQEIEIAENILRVCAHLANHDIQYLILEKWFSLAYPEMHAQSPNFLSDLVVNLCHYSQLKKKSDNVYYMHGIQADAISHYGIADQLSYKSWLDSFASKLFEMQFSMIEPMKEPEVLSKFSHHFEVMIKRYPSDTNSKMLANLHYFYALGIIYISSELYCEHMNAAIDIFKARHNNQGLIISGLMVHLGSYFLLVRKDSRGDDYQQQGYRIRKQALTDILRAPNDFKASIDIDAITPLETFFYGALGIRIDYSSTTSRDIKIDTQALARNLQLTESLLANDHVHPTVINHLVDCFVNMPLCTNADLGQMRMLIPFITDSLRSGIDVGQRDIFIEKFDAIVDGYGMISDEMVMLGGLVVEIYMARKNYDQARYYLDTHLLPKIEHASSEKHHLEVHLTLYRNAAVIALLNEDTSKAKEYFLKYFTIATSRYADDRRLLETVRYYQQALQNDEMTVYDVLSNREYDEHFAAHFDDKSVPANAEHVVPDASSSQSSSFEGVFTAALVQRGLFQNRALDELLKKYHLTTPTQANIHQAFKLACENHTGVDAKALIEYMQNFNWHDKITRMTPLHYAAKLGDPNIITRLLEHNANPVSVDTAGKTPSDYIAPTNKLAWLPFLRLWASQSDNLYQQGQYDQAKMHAKTIIKTLRTKHITDNALLNQAMNMVRHCLEKLSREPQLAPLIPTHPSPS